MAYIGPVRHGRLDSKRPILNWSSFTPDSILHKGRLRFVLFRRFHSLRVTHSMEIVNPPRPRVSLHPTVLPCFYLSTRDGVVVPDPTVRSSESVLRRRCPSGRLAKVVVYLYRSKGNSRESLVIRDTFRMIIPIITK